MASFLYPLDPNYQEPPADPYSDQALGVQPLALDNTVTPEPQRNFTQDLLSNFAGLQADPRGGFFAGLVNALGTAGGISSRAQQRREKYDAMAEERRKERTKLNLAATEKHNEQRFTATQNQKNRDAQGTKTVPLTAEMQKAQPQFATVPLGTPIPITSLETPKIASPPGLEAPKARIVTAADAKRVPGLAPYLGSPVPIDWFKPNEPKPQPVKGADRQALAYFQRAKDAEDSIRSSDQTGRPLEDRIADAGFGRQLQLQNAPNALQSPEQQSYRQAQRAFTEARLRKESGAAIPPHEYEADAKTYFAQPGDSRVVRAQKRAARQAVLNGLANSSGGAYKEFFGEDFAPKFMVALPDGGVASFSSEQEAQAFRKEARLSK